MTVDILNVGKADCIVLRYNDRVCMIDTGEEENLPEIKGYLSAQGIRKIDYLIISHFDKDHVGGAAGIVTDYEVEAVYLNAFEKDTSETRNFFTALRNKGITPHRLTDNTTLSMGKATLEIYPPKETSYADKEDNNSSLVVLASLGEKRLLFCGDAMERRITELLSEDVGDVDFLKIPYHGKNLGNLDSLLDKANPASCAITCSSKNPPSEKVLSLLEDRHIKTYLTQDGDVRISVTPTSLSVKQ